MAEIKAVLNGGYVCISVHRDVIVHNVPDEKDVGIALNAKEAESLRFQLEALLQDLDNRKRGLCPACKGSCENLDGTECDECGGKGICDSSDTESSPD